MSDRFEAGSEQAPEQNKYYAAILDNWARLIDAAPMPLQGDEGAGPDDIPDTEELPGQHTGKERTVSFAGGVMHLSRYDADYRASMQQCLQNMTEAPGIIDPLGHIQFDKQFDEAGITGVHYILDDHRILTFVDTHLTEDEELSGESQACYDFADRLGVGKSWTNIIFRSREPGKAYQESRREVFVLDAVAMHQLGDSLAAVPDVM